MNALVVFSAVVASASAQLVSPYAAGIYGAAPLTYAAAPALAAAAPIAPITAPSSQFQAQDEFGNLNYGYSNINSAKQEVGNAYGGVTGSYSYVDANGIPQRVDYIADALGFRVKATNLPVAPAAPAAAPLEAPVFTGVAPSPVVDTPEVAAAKAEFKKAFDAAVAREKRSADAEPLYTLPYAAAGLYNNWAGLPLNYAANTLAATPLTYAASPLAATYAATPLAATYAASPAIATVAAPAIAPVAATYAAPASVVAAAPAAREAVLTKIKLNPGHAVAYRVD